MARRRHAALLASVLAALALAAPTVAQADDCAGADAEPAADNLVLIGQATLCLLNQQRAGAGLAPLTESGQLTVASAGYSQRMVAESFFEHDSPDGTTLVTRVKGTGYLSGAGDWALGENLGWGQGPLSTPRSLVAAWMNSPGHRANILDHGYTQIGLGLALGTPPDQSWGATYTTDFGTRGTANAPADATVKAAATGHKPPASRKPKAGQTPTRCARAASLHGRRARSGKKGRTAKARKACAGPLRRPRR
jgi:uncharacterized protein YkwD